MTDHWAIIAKPLPGDAGTAVFFYPRITPPKSTPHYTEGERWHGYIGDDEHGYIEAHTKDVDTLHHVTIEMQTVPSEDPSGSYQYAFGIESAARQFLREPGNAHVLALLRRLVTDEDPS